MGSEGRYRGNTGARGVTAVKPRSRSTLRVAEKHLDAALLAVVRRRKLDLSILPGVPFH
jgi:hypothetical protein